MAVWEHLADYVYPHTGAAAPFLAKVALSGGRMVQSLSAEVTKPAIQIAICISNGTSSTSDKIICAAAHDCAYSTTTAAYSAQILRSEAA